MVSQKLEDLLNLSLESTPAQREKSDILDVGFDSREQTWELIIKYNGSLEGLAAMGIRAEPLLAGYAIVTVPQQQIPQLIALPEIEYVEMPKSLQNGLYEAKRESCILPLSQEMAAGRPAAAAGLTGEGVLLAVVDSGIDYQMPDFRTPDGSTRIAWLWDQTLNEMCIRDSRGGSGVPGSGSGLLSHAGSQGRLVFPG